MKIDVRPTQQTYICNKYFQFIPYTLEAQSNIILNVRRYMSTVNILFIARGSRKIKKKKNSQRLKMTLPYTRDRVPFNA